MPKAPGRGKLPAPPLPRRGAAGRGAAAAAATRWRQASSSSASASKANKPAAASAAPSAGPAGAPPTAASSAASAAKRPRRVSEDNAVAATADTDALWGVGSLAEYARSVAGRGIRAPATAAPFSPSPSAAIKYEDAEGADDAPMAASSGKYQSYRLRKKTHQQHTEALCERLLAENHALHVREKKLMYLLLMASQRDAELAHLRLEYANLKRRRSTEQPAHQPDPYPARQHPMLLAQDAQAVVVVGSFSSQSSDCAPTPRRGSATPELSPTPTLVLGAAAADFGAMGLPPLFGAGAGGSAAAGATGELPGLFTSRRRAALTGRPPLARTTTATAAAAGAAGAAADPHGRRAAAAAAAAGSWLAAADTRAPGGPGSMIWPPSSAPAPSAPQASGSQDRAGGLRGLGGGSDGALSAASSFGLQRQPSLPALFPQLSPTKSTSGDHALAATEAARATQEALPAWAPSSQPFSVTSGMGAGSGVAAGGGAAAGPSQALTESQATDDATTHLGGGAAGTAAAATGGLVRAYGFVSPRSTVKRRLIAPPAGAPATDLAHDVYPLPPDSASASPAAARGTRHHHQASAAAATAISLSNEGQPHSDDDDDDDGMPLGYSASFVRAATAAAPAVDGPTTPTAAPAPPMGQSLSFIDRVLSDPHFSVLRDRLIDRLLQTGGTAALRRTSSIASSASSARSPGEPPSPRRPRHTRPSAEATSAAHSTRAGAPSLREEDAFARRFREAPVPPPSQPSAHASQEPFSSFSSPAPAAAGPSAAMLSGPSSSIDRWTALVCRESYSMSL